MSDSEVAGPSGLQNPSETVQERGRRKRRKVAEPSAWKKVMAKTKRNLGQEYVSEKTGKTVSGRKVGPPCRDKCFDKVTMPVVKEIHKNFWNLGSYNEQNAYLGKLIRSNPVKRRRKPVVTAERFRRHTVSYFVLHEKKEIPVCKSGFLSIFNVGEKRIRTLLNKHSPTGTPVHDQRGKTAPAVKFSDEAVNVVREHINQLPAVGSHYTRAKSPHRKYLTPDLNVRKLYVLYQDYVHENYPDIKAVTESKYRAVFKEEFNIGFAPNKADTCNTCDVLSANITHYDSNPSPSVPLAELQETLDEHKQLAGRGMQLLKDFRATYGEDEDVMGVCFDLQQTLPTPKLTTNVSFYKRKMWTYNLGIFNMKTQKSTMYIWDEVTAKRGSSEIASCLSHWLEENHGDETTLILFSDNCAGQNKNMNMVLCLLRMIHQRKFFQIEHYFLVPGHSYMPCDRQFGNIELCLRQRANIETKQDYVRLIKHAVSGGFKVVEPDQSQIYDFPALQKCITKRTSKDLNFKDARVIIFDFHYKEGYQIRGDYGEDTVLHKIRLQPGRARSYNPQVFDLSRTVLRPKYSAPIPLAPEKLKDIGDLLMYIHPDEKAQYFRQIIAAQAELQQEDSDVDEDDGDEVEDNVLDYCRM